MKSIIRILTMSVLLGSVAANAGTFRAQPINDVPAFLNLLTSLKHPAAPDAVACTFRLPGSFSLVDGICASSQGGTQRYAYLQDEQGNKTLVVQTKYPDLGANVAYYNYDANWQSPGMPDEGRAAGYNDDAGMNSGTGVQRNW